jgi:hypothetical protein
VESIQDLQPPSVLDQVNRMGKVGFDNRPQVIGLPGRIRTDLTRVDLKSHPVFLPQRKH